MIERSDWKVNDVRQEAHRLTALVVALFAFVFFVERKMPTTASGNRREISSGTCRRNASSRSGSNGRAASSSFPAAGRAPGNCQAGLVSGGRVSASDVVSQLARLKRAGGDASGARPEDYGLKSPSAKATIVWKDDPKSAKNLSRTLEFGIEIPGTDATAARVAGSDSVLFVPTSLASAVKKGADEFKSKEVFGSPTSDTARLDVDRGRGRLSFAKKDGIWWIRQPLSDLAESDPVEKLVGALTGLRVLEFLLSPAGQGLASLGLAPPLFHVVLADAKGPGSSVDFGATRSDGNSIYARREGRSLRSRAPSSRTFPGKPRRSGSRASCASTAARSRRWTEPSRVPVIPLRERKGVGACPGGR